MPIYAPIELRCESLVDPVGIDVVAPRFAWRMRDDRRGARQTAYRIIATDADAAVSTVPLWDSGRVEGDRSTHVEYSGPALASRRRVRWRVRTWNVDGIESPWSAAATFEIGLLGRGDWRGEWISAAEISGGPRTSAPSPYLRRAFKADEKPIRARLYVTALGLFEVEINGTRVDNDVFAPGRTEYAKRVPYHVYDVTERIVEGDNAIGAILGDGWYCGHVGWNARMADGDRPHLLAQLELFYEGGRSETIATDAAWRYTTDGPIRASDLLMGEDYDARRDLVAWSAAGYDDARWRPVETFVAPPTALVARTMPPVRRIHEIASLPHPTGRGDKWIVDLGQNLVGRCRLRLRDTTPGKTITLRHAEMLNADGSLHTAALRSARATDTYTCGGAPEETYEPRFTFHGFRYVEVGGVDAIEADTIAGIVLHTDLVESGTFECSSPMLNQLQSNIRWSQKGNFLEIPTDCPQRDERLGWTGDAQVFARTSAWNMDVSSFFAKWMQDVADAQLPDGGIPSTVPACPGVMNEGGPAWSDACVIVPWTMYLCYGDARLLDERYATTQRYVEFLVATSRDFVRADESNAWRGYGDWLSINADTPKDLIGTAFTAHVADLMAKIAAVLGRLEDVQKFRALGDAVRAAWQRRFVTPDGLIVGQTQTAYVLALHFRLVPFPLRERVVAMLVRDIESRGTHLSTGFVGTPYLLGVLAEAGRLDVAYALLNQTTCPGWLFPVAHGATTIWERWDAWTPTNGFNDSGMTSFNHYAYGAVGAWMYSTIGGIDTDASRVAFKHSVIAPRPGGGLTFARASLETPFGRVATDWRVEGDAFTLAVTVPPNTTATVHVPARSADVVSEDGHADGLTFVAYRDGAAIYEAVAGTYRLASVI